MVNKYQQIKKEKEYQEILEYKRAHPEKSLRATGKMFHRSGERIRQILELLKGRGQNWEAVENSPLTQVVERV